MKYTISKPEKSFSIPILTAVVVIGLVTLFIAAYFAFNEIMPWYQAIFAAFLIEAGAIVEALAFTKDNNKTAAAGLIFSLIVSLTYNYIQAEQAGATAGISNGWLLFALAVGPLTALTFLSLTLGGQMVEHQKAIAQWERDRQSWYEQKEDERKADAIKERKRLDRAAARSRRESAISTDVSGVQAITDWRKIPAEMLPELADKSPDEVSAAFPLIAPRTAREWSKRLSVRKSSENGRTRPVDAVGGRSSG